MINFVMHFFCTVLPSYFFYSSAFHKFHFYQFEKLFIVRSANIWEPQNYSSLKKWIVLLGEQTYKMKSHWNWANNKKENLCLNENWDKFKSMGPKEKMEKNCSEVEGCCWNFFREAVWSCWHRFWRAVMKMAEIAFRIDRKLRKGSQ